MASGVDFSRGRIDAAVDASMQQILDQAAKAIVRKAQANIQANDQIDTSFLLNSGYTVSALDDSYGQTWPDGVYPWRPSKHGGMSGTARREKAPKLSSKPDRAYAAFAAIYAIYPESQRPFLWPAAADVQAELGRIVSAARGSFS